MNTSESYFKKIIAPILVGGLIPLLIWFLTYLTSREQAKLTSRETTEIRNLDGSVSKRKMEMFK